MIPQKIIVYPKPRYGKRHWSKWLENRLTAKTLLDRACWKGYGAPAQWAAPYIGGAVSSVIGQMTGVGGYADYGLGGIVWEVQNHRDIKVRIEVYGYWSRKLPIEGVKGFPSDWRGEGETFFVINISKLSAPLLAKDPMTAMQKPTERNEMIHRATYAWWSEMYEILFFDTMLRNEGVKIIRPPLEARWDFYSKEVTI